MPCPGDTNITIENGEFAVTEFIHYEDSLHGQATSLRDAVLTYTQREASKIFPSCLEFGVSVDDFVDAILWYEFLSREKRIKCMQAILRERHIPAHENVQRELHILRDVNESVDGVVSNDSTSMKIFARGFGFYVPPLSFVKRYKESRFLESKKGHQEEKEARGSSETHLKKDRAKKNKRSKVSFTESSDKSQEIRSSKARQESNSVAATNKTEKTKVSKNIPSDQKRQVGTEFMKNAFKNPGSLCPADIELQKNFLRAKQVVFNCLAANGFLIFDFICKVGEEPIESIMHEKGLAKKNADDRMQKGSQKVASLVLQEYPEFVKKTPDDKKEAPNTQQLPVAEKSILAMQQRSVWIGKHLACGDGSDSDECDERQKKLEEFYFPTKCLIQELINKENSAVSAFVVEGVRCTDQDKVDKLMVKYGVGVKKIDAEVKKICAKICRKLVHAYQKSQTTQSGGKEDAIECLEDAFKKILTGVYSQKKFKEFCLEDTVSEDSLKIFCRERVLSLEEDDLMQRFQSCYEKEDCVELLLKTIK